MSNLRQAAQQALEVLENSRSLEPVDVDWVKGKRKAVIATLRAALAEPEQEPVAYVNVEKRSLEWALPTRWLTPTVAKMDRVPLYTAPPQQQSDPLIEEQRLDIVATALRGHASTRDAIQWAIEAVERHHGIKG